MVAEHEPANMKDPRLLWTTKACDGNLLLVVEIEMRLDRDATPKTAPFAQVQKLASDPESDAILPYWKPRAEMPRACCSCSTEEDIRRRIETGDQGLSRKPVPRGKTLPVETKSMLRMRQSTSRPPRQRSQEVCHCGSWNVGARHW